MPIYEYICLDCNERFETLRPMNEADTPIDCELCTGNQTSRVLTVFYAKSSDRAITGGTAGCNTCSSHACATCSI